MQKRARYPDIESYGFLSDCHASALVSAAGSIDWCCMPRFDSASVFGRLLDWDHGGYCAIQATNECSTDREYVEGTLVLAQTMQTRSGEARISDCFAMRAGGSERPYRQLIRVVDGTRGNIEFRIEVVPRFDYGEVKPWIRHHAPGVHTAIGGNDALMIECDIDLAIVDLHQLAATCSVRAGERLRLAISFVQPERIDPDPPERVDAAEIDRRVDETVEWWRSWSSRLSIEGEYAPAAKRSAVVLKGCTNAPTGAVVAAPTTSLPEALDGPRNWDYRYSWIRDSHFTVRSLAELGAVAEADGYRRFIERSAAGSVESLQIMYGVGGERRLPELELDALEGYRGCRPVRVGNAAARQKQFDVLGELVGLTWQWHLRGRPPDDDYWRFLVSVVDYTADQWEEPDRGLWEYRGEPKHFVFSKAMCWLALERGLRLADECMRQAPTEKWRAARDEVRAAFEEHGFDPKQNSFVQAFGSDELDAALLLLPAFEVVEYDDPRMIGTVDAIKERLDDHGLLRRYEGDDTLLGTEGAFLPCTFWLAECLARQDRFEEAEAAYDRASAAANNLGLFSEEYDARAEKMRGNFPQALTHLSHITAAVALTRASEPPRLRR